MNSFYTYIPELYLKTYQQRPVYDFRRSPRRGHDRKHLKIVTFFVIYSLILLAF